MMMADIEHIRPRVDNLMPQYLEGHLEWPVCSGSKGTFPPGIRQMARPAAGRHQHHVEADG
jgi:hypothetical protein